VTHVLLVVTYSSETCYEWTLDDTERIGLARDAFEQARTARYVASRMGLVGSSCATSTPPSTSSAASIDRVLLGGGPAALIQSPVHSTTRSGEPSKRAVRAICKPSIRVGVAGCGPVMSWTSKPVLEGGE
jgi:hypothetical protein